MHSTVDRSSMVNATAAGENWPLAANMQVTKVNASAAMPSPFGSAHVGGDGVGVGTGVGCGEGEG